MPANTQVNSTAVKLGQGAVAAALAAAQKTTTVDFQSRLPAGIENGVARMLKAGVQAVKNGPHAGKPMFHARFSVLRPEYHNGQKVGGAQESFMEMLSDTPERTSEKARRTAQQHWDYVFEYLRTWGVNTAQAFGHCKTDADVLRQLDAVCSALVRDKLCVQFRTWAGRKQELEQRGGKYVVLEGDKALDTFPTEAAARAKYKYIGKEPLVNVVWGGKVAAPAAVPPEANVDDATDDAGDHPADDEGGVPPETGDEGEAADEGDDPGELTDEQVDELVATADGEEEGDDKDEAGRQLAAWAAARGVDEATQAKADDWATVAEWARNGVPVSEDEPLKVGDVVRYKAPAGPGKTKTVECEVKKLYKDKAKKDVADLLNTTDGKTTYKAVPADKLERL